MTLILEKQLVLEIANTNVNTTFLASNKTHFSFFSSHFIKASINFRFIYFTMQKINV